MASNAIVFVLLLVLLHLPLGNMQATTSLTTTPGVSTLGRDDDESGISGGAVAGAVIGCIAFTVVVAFFTHRQRNHSRHSAVLSPIPTQQLTPSLGAGDNKLLLKRKSSEPATIPDNADPSNLSPTTIDMLNQGSRISGLLSLDGDIATSSRNSSWSEQPKVANMLRQLATATTGGNSREIELSVAHVQTQLSPRRVTFSSISTQEKHDDGGGDDDGHPEGEGRQRMSSPKLHLPKRKKVSSSRSYSLGCKPPAEQESLESLEEIKTSFSKTLLSSADVLFASPSERRRHKEWTLASPFDLMQSPTRSPSAISNTVPLTELLHDIRCEPQSSIVLHDPTSDALLPVSASSAASNNSLRGSGTDIVSEERQGCTAFEDGSNGPATMDPTPTSLTSLSERSMPEDTHGARVPAHDEQRALSASSVQGYRRGTPRPIAGLSSNPAQQSLRSQVKEGKHGAGKQEVRCPSTLKEEDGDDNC
ncbi:uncharacterized protein LOC135812485 [Sycon ciliatum]|uniref:uncharacterized protein LOC135812485 n=1 Tax=Sycon ciliatum TaxID=27933 RepID=UPI0031F62DD2